MFLKMGITPLCTVLAFFLLPLLAKPSTPAIEDTEIPDDSSYMTTSFEEDIPSDVAFEQKRLHVLCMLGLQNILIETLNKTLYDVRAYDPLTLGEIPDHYLKEGSLEGLSTLRNISDMEVFCGENTVTFKVKIRIDSPYLNFNWERRILFSFEGKLWLKADVLEVRLVLQVDRGFKFLLEKAQITKLTGFKFGFSGLGPLNPLISGSVNLLEKIWNGKIVRKLEKIMYRELQKEVAKLDNPLG